MNLEERADCKEATRRETRRSALHVGGSVHSVLKAWKARWRGEAPTLKELHDEFSKAWANQTEEPVHWEVGKEEEQKKVGWRLLETYFRESNIPATLKPEAVEVPVEAHLGNHGLSLTFAS
jgi:putative RecB family exonuclease